MTRLLSIFALLGLATVSFADQFTVDKDTTVLAVPGAVASSAIGSVSNWVSGKAYVAGDIVKAKGQPYVCRYGGTGSAVDTNALFNGKTTVTDDSVTWIKTTVGERMMVLIQKVSGGTLTINFANGAVVLTFDGAALALSEEAIYPGNFTVTASDANVVVNTVWF